MANVRITEKDLTTNASPDQLVDVAYVPGFSYTKCRDDGPLFCDTLDKFKDTFGKSCPKYTSGYTFDVYYDSNDSTKKQSISFGSGDNDCGYVYACELLRAGMPIYYEAVNAVASTTADISAQIMYNAMLGTVVPEKETESPSGAFVVATETEKAKLTITLPNTKDRFSGVIDFYITSGEGEAATTSKYAIDSKYYEISHLFGETTQVIIRFHEDALAICTEAGMRQAIFISTLAEGKLQATYKYLDGTQEAAEDSIFEKMKDRGTYNIKYLTSGGYPTFEYNGQGATQHSKGEVVGKMVSVCSAINGITDDSEECGRGDCVALIDAFLIKERPLIGNGSPIQEIQELSGPEYTYASMTYPGATFDLADSYNGVGQMDLPGSFAYLTCLAQSIRKYDNFQAIAGVTRGTVSNIHYNAETDKYSMATNKPLTNYIANHYYSKPTNPTAEADAGVSINPITRINSYGQVIWGNRTLLKSTVADGVKATGFLNIRNMMSDIKKEIYKNARYLMFEQNGDVLWATFRLKMLPLLTKLNNGGGISSYTISRDVNKTSKTKLYAHIQIVPMYAVETFDVTVSVTDEAVTVETE